MLDEDNAVAAEQARRPQVEPVQIHRTGSAPTADSTEEIRTVREGKAEKMLAFAHCGQLLLLMRREPTVVAQNDHHVKLGVLSATISL